MSDDRVTHFGIGINTALCVYASGDPQPSNSPKVWGHWLTKDREDVDCRECLDWMHA